MLGQTRDDAAGEAFDKAARILGLGYPGGPVIEQAAAKGTPSIPLPRAWLKGTSDFSFSGVKTALQQLVINGKISTGDGKQDGLPTRNDAAASFQESVVEVLVAKTVAAAREHGVGRILLAGGVACNTRLRQRLVAESPIPVSMPAPILCTDNAAMTAACGYYRFQAGKENGLDLDAIAGLKLV